MRSARDVLNSFSVLYFFFFVCILFGHFKLLSGIIPFSNAHFPLCNLNVAFIQSVLTLTYYKCPSSMNTYAPLDSGSCFPPINESAGFVCSYMKQHCTNLSNRYLSYYYCGKVSYPLVSQFVLALFFVVAIVFLFFALGILASDYLTPNLEYLSKLLHLDERMAGLTLLSLANGAPDISSTYAAMRSHSVSLAIGELLGSVNFELTMVIGCMAMVKPFRVSNSVIFRDLVVFGLLILLTLWFLSDGKITRIESLLMVASYFLFIFLSWFGPKIFTDDIQNEETRSPPTFNGVVKPDESSFMTNPRTDLSMLRLTQSIENMEQKKPYRLSLVDSLRLAFVRWHHKEEAAPDSANSVLTEPIIPSMVVTDGQNEPLSSPIRPQLSSSFASAPELRTADNFKSITCIDSAFSDEQQNPNVLEVPTRSRGNSYGSTSSSNESVCSYGSAILSAVGIPVDSYSTYEPERQLLYRIIPRWSNIHVQGSFWSTVINILTLPYVVLFNILVPVPIPEKVRSDVREEEKLRSMSLFCIQLLVILLIFCWRHFELPVIVLSLIFMTAIFLLHVFSSSFYSAIFEPLASFVGFLSVLYLIVFTASGIVGILKDAAVVYNVKESLLGLTVLSLGNSVGDLVTNTTLASLGFALTGLNSCFGSPLLYVLFGIGLNSIVVSFTEHKNDITFQVDRSLLFTAYSIIFILVFYMIAIPLTNWRFNRKIGLLSMVIWVIVTMLNIYLG